jgi:hypothetical protein
MAEIRNYTMNFGPQHPCARRVAARARADGGRSNGGSAHRLPHRAIEACRNQTHLQTPPYMYA